MRKYESRSKTLNPVVNTNTNTSGQNQIQSQQTMIDSRIFFCLFLSLCINAHMLHDLIRNFDFTLKNTLSKLVEQFRVFLP